MVILQSMLFLTKKTVRDVLPETNVPAKERTGRSMTLRAESDWQALQQARAYQKTDEFKAIFKERAGIEGTISQAVRAFELRHCRYIGLKKTKLQHIVTAAAINIVRLTAWLRGEPLAQTRKSSFAQLAPA